MAWIDQFLNEWLQTPDGAEWAKQYIEETNDPSIAKNRRRGEARHEALMSFLDWLQSLPAGHDLPAGFGNRWLKWLRRFEKEEIDKLPAKERSADRVRKLVKRAWITTELDDPDEPRYGRFEFHDELPSKDKHPVTVVLIHQKGRWQMPEWQLLYAKAHPFVRAFCGTLPVLSDKEAVLGKLNWSLTLGGTGDTPGALLANAALHLRGALVQDSKPSISNESDQCIPFQQLPDSSPFWMVLNAAIGFGRMLQYQEVFGDGEVATLIQKAIVNPGGKAPDQWSKHIERLVSDFASQECEELTPSNLLGWLGGKRGANDLDPIRFDASGKGCVLNGISWDQFKNRVKSVKRKKGF